MPVFFSAAFLVVALDQYVKYIVKTKMALYQSITVIPDFFRITYIENSGIALGMFGQHENQAKRWILLGMVLIAMVLVTVYWVKYGRKKFIYDITCGMIIGGALGNFIDRLITGRVVDFLEFGIKQHTFPVFNIADSAVSVGVAIFVIYMVFSKEEKKEAPDAPDTL
jgi:signal peptidase II